MTEISREIVGSETVPQGLCIETLLSCHKEARNYIIEQKENSFSEGNSILLVDTNTNKVYGYIITIEMNIPHISDAFSGQEYIIKRLSESEGLYIPKVVLHTDLDNETITCMLNALHLVYCNADLSDNKKYIWMDFGIRGIDFCFTKQEDKFFTSSPNAIANAFYKYLYKTGIKCTDILK